MYPERLAVSDALVYDIRKGRRQEKRTGKAFAQIRSGRVPDLSARAPISPQFIRDSIFAQFVPVMRTWKHEMVPP